MRTYVVITDSTNCTIRVFPNTGRNYLPDYPHHACFGENLKLSEALRRAADLAEWYEKHTSDEDDPVYINLSEPTRQ